MIRKYNQSTMRFARNARRVRFAAQSKKTGAFKDNKAAKREIVLSAAHCALIVLSVYINFQEVNITEKQE